MSQDFTDTRKRRDCVPKASATHALASESDPACREIDKDLRRHFQSRVRGLEPLGLYLEDCSISGEWRVASAAMVFLSAVAVISWTIHTGIGTRPSH